MRNWRVKEKVPLAVVVVVATVAKAPTPAFRVCKFTVTPGIGVEVAVRRTRPRNLLKKSTRNPAV
jgi:hypothetical protein